MTITMKVSLQTTVSEYISPQCRSILVHIQFLMLACSWTIQLCVVAAMVCARGDHPYAIANSRFVGYLVVQLGYAHSYVNSAIPKLTKLYSNRWHYMYLEYSLQHLDRNYKWLGIIYICSYGMSPPLWCMHFQMAIAIMWVAYWCLCWQIRCIPFGVYV